jgi:two-component system cell cycle sensor histidine kinase/response regulator CckA
MALGDTTENPLDQTDMDSEVDRHRISQALESSSWEVLQSLPEAMLCIDLEGRIVECNQAAAALGGYSRDELVGSLFIELVHPDDRVTVWASMVPAMTGRQEVLEMRVAAKDGSVLTASMNSTPLRDQGRTVGLVVIGRDVTELKKAQQALEQGNLDLLFLNEVSQAVTSTLDLSEVLTKLMARINDVLGMEAASILLVDEPTGELVFATAAGGGAEQVKGLRLQPGQGIAGWVAQQGQTLMVSDVREDPRFYPEIDRISGFVTRSVLCVPLKIKGRVVGVVEALNKAEGTFTPHDRHLLEAMAPTAAIAIENAQFYQALWESEETYRTLSESSLVGVYLIQDDLFCYVNRQLADLFGYTQDELTDLKGPLDLVALEDRLLVKDNLRRRLEGEVESAHYTFRGLRKDGTIFDVEVFGAVTLYKGRPAILGTLLDITERNQLEEQLRRSQKMEALGTLAGGIAHDFNNILGGILGYASFIHTQMTTDNPFRDDVETIIHSAQRAAELTNQLLAFARGGRPETRPVDVCGIIHEVVKLLDRTVDKSIVIEPRRASELPAVEGDPVQLQQMLLNLCLNACDAMPAGGILTIEAQNAPLDTVRTLPDLNPRDYVHLIVTDTGMGMDAEAMSHLFEPFFTTKREQTGSRHSGLGLAMVYSIVHNHGGDVHAESELGRGSTFHVYLPASRRPVAPPNGQVEAPAGGTETILVVDDEEVIRDVAQRILCSAGYTVLMAENGVQAIEVFRQRHKEISLVILDMIMPEMGGAETFARLRGIDPQVRALLSTGYSREGQAEDILEAGVQGFLQKPYTVEDVLHKVRVVLDE